MNTESNNALFMSLHNSIADSILHHRYHPMLARLGSMTQAELRTTIENYSCLSNRAIQFLITALVYSKEWPNLYNEIERNIEEEKGINTGGMSHLAMMRQGYSSELGIDTSNVIPFRCTKDFLENMNNVFLNESLPYVAGAVLAFESIAVEEFKILDSLVRQYLFLKDKEYSGLTKMYIEGHKDFEIEHSSGLRKAIASHLEDGDSRQVEFGFNAVGREMSTWWHNLNQRVKKKYHKNKER